MIDPVIGPWCFERYYQIAGMDGGATWGAGSRIGKNGGIAVKSEDLTRRGKKGIILYLASAENRGLGDDLPKNTPKGG